MPLHSGGGEQHRLHAPLCTCAHASILEAVPPPSAAAQGGPRVPWCAPPARPCFGMAGSRQVPQRCEFHSQRIRVAVCKPPPCGGIGQEKTCNLHAMARSGPHIFAAFGCICGPFFRRRRCCRGVVAAWGPPLGRPSRGLWTAAFLCALAPRGGAGMLPFGGGAVGLLGRGGGVALRPLPFLIWCMARSWARPSRFVDPRCALGAKTQVDALSTFAGL